MTPTQRTLQLYRKEGYTCAIAEHWNHFARIRQDLFGFIDIVACKPGAQILAIQTTAAAVADRVRKIRALPAAKCWLESGGAIAVVGWRKLKQNRSRATWEPRIVELVLIEDEIRAV